MRQADDRLAAAGQKKKSTCTKNPIYTKPLMTCWCRPGSGSASLLPLLPLFPR